MTHIVLLGDSIFDNQPYVADGQAVIHQLQGKLPPGSKATLLAVDGAIARDIPFQFRKLPKDATHLFLSVGGNDALQEINYLYKPARSVAEVLIDFAKFADRFRKDYAAALNCLLTAKRPLTVCTIYNPCFERHEEQLIAQTALTFWNDIITSEALKRNLPVIDLRPLFNDPRDYANPIEPSVQGGQKLTDRIMTQVFAEGAA